jgi:hypothetical protein
MKEPTHMSDDALPKVRLSELIERKRNEGAMEIDLDDGKPPIILDAPELWPDEFRKIAGDGKSTDEDIAKLLLGADNWKRFVAAGGTQGLFLSLLQERHNLTVGESPASST